MEDIKQVVYSVLVSCSNNATVDSLCKDFLALDGRPLPFQALGYNSPLDLLLAMPELVVVEFKSGGNSPSLRVIPSEKSQHISKMVQNQKTSTDPPPRQKYFKANFQRFKRPPPIPSWNMHNHSQADQHVPHTRATYTPRSALFESRCTFEDSKVEFRQRLYPEDVLGPNQNVPQVELPAHVVCGLTLEVLVSEVLSPRQFWVIMRGDKYNIALDKMMTDLQGHYILHHTLYKMPLMAVQVNQDCCCKHGDKWHRARITEILSLFEVMVTFYDYGTQTKIRIDDLRFLCSKFSKLPAQAIKSSLANVEPRDRSNVWSRSVSYWLSGKIYNKPLVAIICTIHVQERHLSLSLVDTTGEEDIHINDLLVKEGYARYILGVEDIAWHAIPVLQQFKRGSIFDQLQKFDYF